MIRTTHFHYPSARDGCSIHALEWAPEGPPGESFSWSTGSPSISAAMTETARFWRNTALVCGGDHLGHGRTVTDGSYGFFAPENGWTLAARDVRALRKLEGAHHPKLPYFLLGHSMGSFLTRTYLILWPGTVSGAVLMGTGQEPAPWWRWANASQPWSAAAWVPAGSVRWYTPCPFGAYNRRFRPSRTPSDWLSRDPAEVDAFPRRPPLPVPPHRLPVPGHDGRPPAHRPAGPAGPDGSLRPGLLSLRPGGTRWAAWAAAWNRWSECFQDAGCRDLSLHLYPGARHELFHEQNRREVWADLLDWLEDRLPPSGPLDGGTPNG